jgi:hypothetical protein
VRLCKWLLCRWVNVLVLGLERVCVLALRGEWPKSQMTTLRLESVDGHLVDVFRVAWLSKHSCRGAMVATDFLWHCTLYCHCLK